MCDEKITVPLCKTKLSICTLKTETNVTLMSIDIVKKLSEIHYCIQYPTLTYWIAFWFYSLFDSIFLSISRF